jgi:hypothetical protein
MAYPQKQPLFVPYGGLATDIDDKLLPLGRALDLENVFVKRRGAQEGTIEVIKRYGTTSLPAFGNTAGQLGTHLGALVNVGTLLATLATPTSVACTPVASSDMRPSIAAELTRVSSGAMSSNVAYGGGFYWVIWQDTVTIGTPTVLRAVAMDEATGHRAFETSFAPAGGATGFSSWRVVYVGGLAVFVYQEDNGAIRFLSVNPAASFATATAATAAATGVGGPYQAYWFDVTTRSNTTVVVGFADPTATFAEALDVAVSTLAITAWRPRTAAGANIAVSSLGWMKDDGASGKLALISGQAAAGLRVHWDFPLAGATRDATATHVIDAAFTGAGAFLAGNTTTNSATGEYVLAYDQGAVPDRVIYKATRIGGVVSAGGIVARGQSLRSKLWTFGGDHFVVGALETATQGTHYVLRVPYGPVFATPTPLCKIGVRQGFGGNLPHMSDVVSPRAGEFTLGINYTPRFDAVFNANSFGVQLATVTHPTLPYSALGKPKEAVGSMFAPGGAVAQFDGSRFFEAGFAYSPEQATTLTPSPTGSLTPSSTYYYVAVFVRTDAQGRLWRSAPSIPKSVALGAGDGRVTTVWPTLRLTGNNNVQLEIYRGIAGDDQDFHKVTAVANDTSVDTVTYIDTASDATIVGLETLYSNGNILANETPAGFVDMTEAQNRTWGISTDDSQLLWYSKEHVVGKGIEFNGEELVIDVRDERGPMRALAQLDGRPIIFKGDAVYAVGGAGPDNAGNGGSYSAQIICSGIGTVNAQSICETRDGVIFKSTAQRAGFFIVDRGLTVTPIGAPVQRWDSETVVASIFLSKQLQARFYTTSGRTLVYDLVTGIWTTYTGQPALTAVAWDGVAVYAPVGGGVARYEDTTHATLTDGGAAYEMLVGGAWVQVNQVKGYQRFYRQMPSGQVDRGTVVMKMRLYKNLQPAMLVSAKATVVTGQPFEPELRFSAKVASVRTVISDLGSTTGVLRLSGVTYELALRPGLRPVPAGARAA